MMIEGTADAAATDANVLMQRARSASRYPYLRSARSDPSRFNPSSSGEVWSYAAPSVRRCSTMHLATEGAPLRRYGVERFAPVDTTY